MIVVVAVVVGGDDDVIDLNDVDCFGMLTQLNHAILQGHGDLCAVYAAKMVAIPYLS